MIHGAAYMNEEAVHLLGSVRIEPTLWIERVAIVTEKLGISVEDPRINA